MLSANLRVNSERFRANFEELSHIGTTGDGGVNRPTFSPAHFKAREWFRKQAAAAKDLSQLFRNTPGLVEEDQNLILETYHSHWPGFGKVFADRAGRDEGKVLSRVEKKRRRAEHLQQLEKDSASIAGRD